MGLTIDEERKVNPNLTKEQWYDFWSRIRKAGRRPDWLGFSKQHLDWLVVRQRFYDHIQRHTWNGEVSFNVSGMDCDCVRYEYSRIIPAHPPIAIERMIEREYYDAEGPVSVWIDWPQAAIPSASRDLALEAFEDGHPHIVSEVRYESH